MKTLQETYYRIIHKLEMEGKPLTKKNITKAYNEHLRYQESNKTPLERND